MDKALEERLEAAIKAVAELQAAMVDSLMKYEMSYDTCHRVTQIRITLDVQVRQSFEDLVPRRPADPA